MTEMTSLPFDTVVLMEDGLELRIDANSFLAMPLHKRVRLILERRVSLFDRDTPVSLGAALKSASVKEALGRHRRT